MKTLHAILSAAIVALAMSATTALSDHELVRAFNITSEVIALRLLQEAKERGAYVFSYEWLWDDNKVMPIDNQKLSFIGIDATYLNSLCLSPEDRSTSAALYRSSTIFGSSSRT